MTETPATASTAELWHPAVPVAYYACVIVLAMAAFEPVCTALALMGGLLFSLRLFGVRDALRPLAWQLPLLALVCLANPFFTGLGSTPLGTIGRRTLYLESLAYGLNMGALLVTMLTWVRVAAARVTTDMALAVFARPLPLVALMTSMMLRLTPAFIRRGRDVDALQEACSSARSAQSGAAAGADALARRARLVTVLVGWGLEDSFELADSLQARGWNCGARRTSHCRERFRWRDGLALALLAALIAADALQLAQVVGAFHYYPTIAALAPAWRYLPHAALVCLPLALQALDDLRWLREEQR